MRPPSHTDELRDAVREPARNSTDQDVRERSRYGRVSRRLPNFNLLEHSPKYTLDSYIFLRRDEINIKLDSYDKKIDNLKLDINKMEREINIINSKLQYKVQFIKKYEKEKDSLLKFSNTICLTLTTGDLPSCAVCLGSIPKNNVAITNCRHIYCKECIARSLAFSTRCPVCRNHICPRGISIINLEDNKSYKNEARPTNETIPTNEIIPTNETIPTNEDCSDDEKEEIVEPLPIQTPPLPPRPVQNNYNYRPAGQTNYEYNIQGRTRVSGGGDSYGNRNRGNNIRNRGRLDVSPTRRIDYEQYRIWSQVDNRIDNNSREYGNNRPPILPPLDIPERDDTHYNGLSPPNNRMYINQPRVDQYRRNRNQP